MKGFLDGRTVRKIGDMYIAPDKGTENACFVTKPAPAPPTTGSNIQPPTPTQDDRLVNIVEKFADDLAEKRRIITELLVKVDDFAHALAVTECQLEEARKRLERYEGGAK